MEQIILKFAEFLKQKGLLLATGQILNAITAASKVGFESNHDLRRALRACFALNAEQFKLFNDLFEDFFFKTAQDEDNLKALALRTKSPELSFGLEHKENDENKRQPAKISLGSAYEVLGKKGFASLDKDQALNMAQEVEQLLKPLAQKLSRRKKPKGHKELYWQATFRRGLQSGGELVDLRFKRPKHKPTRLVILADVSGSMDMATPFLFHFLKGLAKAWNQVEIFIFATRLTRITNPLFKLPVKTLIKRLPQLAPDLAGSTLIGLCLSKLFSHQRGRPTSNSLVLIISDGWDRGDPFELNRQMARLKARSHRIIWLNPLLESPRYQPINQGMKAALPFVDHFLGCHNLESLKKTAQLMEQAIK